MAVSTTLDRAAVRSGRWLSANPSKAWGETFFMANDFMADQFYYLDRERMLRFGSILYACYFVVSFPMVYRLDEGRDENWPLRRVAVESLATGMLVFILLDAWAKIIGPI